MRGPGSTVRLVRLFGITLLVAYLLEIGLWRFLVTASLVASFTAVIFGRAYWRFCAQAWADFRGPSVWRPLALESVLLTLMHAALVQAQSLGLVVANGWVNMGQALHGLEGTWHLAIPNPQPPWSAWFWLSIYLFIFPALVFGTVIALNGRKELKLLGRFLRASNLVAWSALPMFAILNVPEVWLQIQGYQPPVVSVGDGLTFYRLLSGPFNCLPSLHCSLSLLALGACWRSSLPTLRWLGPVLAILVCLSTVATGIHWLVDVASSLPWAWLAWAVAGRWRWPWDAEARVA